MRLIDADATLDIMPQDLPYRGAVRRVLMQAPEVEAITKEELIEIFDEIYDALECFSGAFLAGRLREIEKEHLE